MPTVEVDLKALLISAHFGPITLGMSRSQVVNVIGWPDKWHPAAKLTADVWVYDWIEFYFDVEDHLSVIRSDHIDALEDNERFTFQPSILNPRLSLEAAEKFVTAENIHFQKSKHPKYEISYLNFQSGVELSFEPDEDQPSEPYLSAFHCRISA